MKFSSFLQNTELRDNQHYVQYYGLIGSCIVMVLIPALILLLTCTALRRAIPDGSQKKKILRIMVIVIIMFVICHVPKVRSKTRTPTQDF